MKFKLLRVIPTLNAFTLPFERSVSAILDKSFIVKESCKISKTKRIFRPIIQKCLPIHYLVFERTSIQENWSIYQEVHHGKTISKTIKWPPTLFPTSCFYWFVIIDFVQIDLTTLIPFWNRMRKFVDQKNTIKYYLH